jgi:hypothetical protein
MKKLISFLLVLVLFTSPTAVFAIAEQYTVSETNEVETALIDETEIETSYQRFCEHINQHQILADISYDIYAEGFLNSGYSTIEEYETAYESIFIDNTAPQLYSGSSGGSLRYYYNTGTSCPLSAVYSNTSYNILNTLQAGDLIFEDAGGPGGLLNHIAIVEGKFYDSTQGRYYIRLVEAIDIGVKRSILDDTRLVERQGTVLRVTATSTAKTNAVIFAVSALGSSYLYDGAWDTSSSETDWYCSELAYASYYYSNVILATGGFPSVPGVLPTDILNSSLTTTILTY